MMREHYRVKALRPLMATVVESGRRRKRRVNVGDEVTVNAHQRRVFDKAMGARGGYVEDVFSSTQLERKTKTQLLVMLDERQPDHALSASNTKAEIISALMGI